MLNKIVKCGKLQISNSNSFTLIAGPCQLENEKHAMSVAERLKVMTEKLNIGLIYKTSFDKANRTSLKGIRGTGLKKSLPIFDKIRKDLGIPVLTDIHTIDQCELVAKHVDVLQIPAFLCRQTDLLVAAAKTGKVVNIKKGQFLSPYKVKNIIDKVSATGNNNILVTERGNSFGYDSLTSDMRSIQIMKEFGFPVIYDATHSAQIPGNFEETTSGNRQFIPGQIYSAVASGCDGIFMEVHDNVDHALSDASTQWPLDKLEPILVSMLAFRETYLNHGKENG